MGKKHLKFVSIPEALKELNNTLMMQSEVKKLEEIASLLTGFGEFEIRKDIVKVHPLELVDRHGLWIDSAGSKKFYYGDDLVEFFMDLLNPKPPETIAELYSNIEWVNANVAKHPDTGVTGLLIETEMEKFECVQCGHCCLDLSEIMNLGSDQGRMPSAGARAKKQDRFKALECPFYRRKEAFKERAAFCKSSS